MNETTRNFTGQHKNATGLLYYHTRYYDPGLGRFLSPDTVVPGNASGGMEGVQLRPLTVAFHTHSQSAALVHATIATS